ncbi:MAG: cob(I)yrinic acid a,c-diamide adenosyltransferase [Acidimicrobiia bacterium]|nr:cob(I)yrinic acid a,c-diamide adenosyltransferase [Acidimicrobiia bacterium]
MRIYTKKGDDGTTGLFYGGRVSKADGGPEAYGTVDEAVSALGMARAVTPDEAMAHEILRVQRELFVVAAELATAPGSRGKLVDGVSRTTAAMVETLEAAIDRVVDEVGMPTEFVVPGGDPAAAALDVARTVVRRAERRAVAYAADGGLDDTEVVRYLNRLADYLYMLARAAEQEWTPSRAKEK